MIEGGADVRALREDQGRGDDRALVRAELPARAGGQGRRADRRRGGAARPPAAGADPRRRCARRSRRGHGEDDLAATFLARARALIIVDFQNDFTPGGALAVPHGDEIAAAAQRAGRLRRLRPRRRHARLASRRPLSFAAKAARGRCTASPGTQGAQLHPTLDRTNVDVIVDKGQAVDTDGYSGFEGTDLEAILRERGITAGHRRRPRDRLLRQEHRAGRAARGLPGHGRQHRRARRRGRAGRLRARAGRGARRRRRDGVKRSGPTG